MLMRVGAWSSSAALVGVLAWVTRRDQSRACNDRTFGVAVTAMLLVSPISWPNYFVLLLVPLVVFWLGLPPSRWAKASYMVILGSLWLSPHMLWSAFAFRGRSATPIEALLVLSYHCYTLLGLFALGVLQARDKQVQPAAVGGPVAV
jgi:hypothetical protein